MWLEFIIFLLTIVLAWFAFEYPKKQNKDPIKAYSFSGGGYHSASGILNIFQNVCYAKKSTFKQLIKDLRYVSGTSGGSWTMCLLNYSKTFLFDNIDYRSDLSEEEHLQRLDKNFWQPMKNTNDPTKVIALFDPANAKATWRNLFKESMGKYVDYGDIHDVNNASKHVKTVFTATVNSQGILKNTNFLGQGLEKNLEKLIDNTKKSLFGLFQSIEFRDRDKFTDPKMLYSHFRYSNYQDDFDNFSGQIDFLPISFTGNLKRMSSIFPTRLNIQNQMSPNLKQKKLIQIKSRSKFDIRKISAIDAAAASSSFFGLLDNDTFRNKLLAPLSNLFQFGLATNFIWNQLINIIKKTDVTGKNIFKPGLSQGMMIQDKKVTLNNTGFQNTTVGIDDFVLKLADGGYADNSGSASVISKIQELEGLHRDIHLTYFDTAAGNFGKNRKYMYGDLVDHLLGLKTTTRIRNRDNWEFESRFNKKSNELHLKPNINDVVQWYQASTHCMNKKKVLIDTSFTFEKMNVRFLRFECVTIENQFFHIRPGQKVQFSVISTDSNGTSMCGFNYDTLRQNVSIAILKEKLQDPFVKYTELAHKLHRKMVSDSAFRKLLLDFV